MLPKLCKNGHYYNPNESETCPICDGRSSIGVTIPLGGSNAQDNGIGRTIPLGGPNDTPYNGGGAINITAPPPPGVTSFIDNDKTSDIKPVRGWLVVIKGEKVGLDFRIHTGHNSIGRAKSNNICIDFDAAVSKEKACFVIYDQRDNQFHIMSGESTNNIYVNSELLLMPKKLCDNDIIEIGETQLVFRSLCNEQFIY